MKHFFQVVEQAGGYESLVRAVNPLLPAAARPLTRQAVRQWVKRDMDVPAEYCTTIAHLYPIPLQLLNPKANFHLAPLVAR